MKVLMSAYACEPNKGSEQEVGWRWAMEIAKVCDVTVITRSNSRPLIEQWCLKHPGEMNAKFIYQDLGGFLLWIKKNIPGGLYLYYVIWQFKLRGLSRRLIKIEAYDIHHHVTFASFRLPVGLAVSPMVWGPVGGGEKANPKLFTDHGSILARLREYFRNFCTEISKITLPLTCPLLKQSIGVALASTPETKRILEKSGLKVAMMPAIGCDLQTANQNKSRKSDETLRLLYCGRLHLLKGIHLLLHAVAGLQSERIQLSILGNGPEEKRLKNLSRKLNISDIVSFKGQISRDELDTIYHSHDLLVAPSLYESGGLSILEGFAHGLPAIVLDCGGPSLSVADGCGIRIKSNLTQNETVRAIAEAIRTYIHAPHLLQKHGINAQAHLQHAYGWNTKRKEMHSIYQMLLSKRGSKDHE